jgi:hypothetical protein
MIVRIHASGKSFSGTAAYLTHDPKAQTDERVAWTHTQNLANDHVPSAVDEMLWTARNAELLKQEAGIRAGGRATEYPVKHLSLNWSPDENPTQEHMIETADDFLRHMKWQQHQAIYVAHDDKSYAHVHVLLNSVHPDTGLQLDDGFERRRAQAWALAYEREQGRIYCDQRLKEPAERESAPPRNIWIAFQENERDFARTENALRQQESIVAGEINNQEKSRSSEWKNLKEIQKDERTEFFADGKTEFSALRLSIYREVRAEFRGRWRDFYAGQEGSDPDRVAQLKAELVADQKAVLEGRRDQACSELREYRDGIYRDLLTEQRETRLELRSRQEAGLDNLPFIQRLKGDDSPQDIRTSFRGAAEATTQPGDDREDSADVAAATPQDDHGSANAGASVGSAGTGIALGFCSVFDSLLSIFEGPQPVVRVAPDALQAAADEACKRQEREQDEAEQETQKRQRSVYGE